MLIITRRTDESLVINDNIEVVVLGVRGDYVRIGIEAPKSIPVHRYEVWERIQKEKANES